MSTQKPGIIPTLLSPDCNKHIAWIKNVFDAKEESLYRSKDEKTVMHCSLLLNQGCVFLCDRSTSLEKAGQEPEDGSNAESRGTVLHLELEDPSPFWKKALNNGATVVEHLKEQYWGTEYGSVRDPFGFVWGFMKGGEYRKLGVIPYLLTDEGKCEAYVEWLVKAFNGETKVKFPEDGGLIQHCCVKINNGFVYLADDIKMDEHKRETRGLNLDVVCHMDVPDPKGTWAGLIENEAESVVDLKVQFWGDLYGTVRDATGHMWSLCEATTPPSSSSNQTPSGGYSKARGVISYILSPDCDKHVQWIEKVLGGEVKERRYTEAKKTMHCTMVVNEGTLMICDSQVDCSAPPTSKGEEGGTGNGVSSTKDGPPPDQTGFILHLNVPDPDLIWKKAMGNGGVQIMELKQQFWGDYYGTFQDPFGYQWSVLKIE